MFYDENSKLKSLELFEEDIRGYRHHYLKGVWEYETEDGRYELTIPKMDLGNLFFSVPRIERNYCLDGVTEGRIPVYLDYLPLRRDELGNDCYIKELEKFEKEMTLEEVEKKLGYKVKLVSGKEK